MIETLQAYDVNQVRGTFAAKLAFLRECLRSNVASAMEYRASFLMQIMGMVINDSLWVTFWGLYFQRFPILNGWTFTDLAAMWAVITLSFGLAFGLFWNIGRIPELVTQGQLDYYLALPKNVLLHLAFAQIRPVNLGDMVFGPILFVVFVSTAPEKLAVYLLVSVLAAVVYLAFHLLAGSLTFFVGNSESFTNGVSMSLIHFSTYPTRLFSGFTRVLLFTAIPAGFISEVPVELIREFSWPELGKLALAATIFAALSIAVFYRGLRRYESGNLIAMRS